MNWKMISAVIGAAIVTFLVTFFMTKGTDVVEAGLDAQTKDAIRQVLKEEMRVDINGETKTYGQVLSSMHTKLTTLEVTVGVLIKD